MNTPYRPYADQLSVAQTALFNARMNESDAWLTYREKYDDAVFSSEYQAMARGKTKALQVEREAWLNRQTRSAYRAYREAKVQREVEVDRMRVLMALVESYSEEAF